MNTKDKNIKLDMDFEEVIERISKTDNAEVINITKENMKDNTIDNLLREFESKAQKDKNGVEFWYARELQELLGYNKWENFKHVIEKAQLSCRQFKQDIGLHWIPDVRKSISGKGKEQESEDYKLTRYACYLIAQNGDPRKKPVAFAQTYFAIQTRKKELEDKEFATLPEEERRLRIRSDIKEHNKLLASAAKKAGVINNFDFAIFQNHGYKGLYGGLDKKAIQRKKGLNKKSDKEILDYMGSEELAANFFRVTQTEAKLKKDGVYGKKQANTTHFEVGAKVRESMVNKPEELVVPEESIKQLERKKKKEQKTLEQENKKQIGNN